MSSDGLALVAAGAAAAGLMWCVNSKRMDAPLPESSVCASARRAETVSARLADGPTVSRSWWDDLFSMSDEGVTASKDMGGSATPSMNAQRLVALQSSTKIKEPVETTNFKLRGVHTNLTQMAVDRCLGASKVKHDPTSVLYFNQQD